MIFNSYWLTYAARVFLHLFCNVIFVDYQYKENDISLSKSSAFTSGNTCFYLLKQII